MACRIGKYFRRIEEIETDYEIRLWKKLVFLKLYELIHVFDVCRQGGVSNDIELPNAAWQCDG